MKKQQVLFLGFTLLAGSALFSMEQGNKSLTSKCSKDNLLISPEVKAMNDKVESQKKQRENSLSAPYGCDDLFPGCGNLSCYYPSEFGRKVRGDWYPRSWAPFVPER